MNYGNKVGKVISIFNGFVFTLNLGMILCSVSLGYADPREVIVPAFLAIIYVILGAYYNEFL